jgi:hypothetical protein
MRKAHQALGRAMQICWFHNSATFRGIIHTNLCLRAIMEPLLTAVQVLRTSTSVQQLDIRLRVLLPILRGLIPEW